MRLLHLEDDDRDAELIQARLEGGGLEFTIVHARTGGEFDAALASGSYDLILTDFNVPGYDGFSALALSRERQPDTPVIVISGALGEDDAIRCLQLGATDYLLKQRLDRLVPSVLRALQEAETLRQRRQAEAELRESEERHRLLFQSNPVPLWVYDAESLRFLAVNPSAVSAYGYSEEEFLTMTVRDLSLADDLTPQEREVKQQARRHRKKNEEIIDVEVTSEAIDFGGRPARLALAIDVTERKRADERLRQQEEQYRAIVEAVTNAILILDFSGRIVTANKAARQMSGYALAELVGASARDLVRTEDRAKLDFLAAKVAEGEPAYAEAVHLRKDGSELNVVIDSTAFQMNGVPHQLLIISNVSEQKRLQQQLERTERISSLGRLAASIAHEMNNVMMSILPFTEIVKRRAQGDPTLENAVTHIMKGIARGKGVTQEILRFTRAADEVELAPIDGSRFLSDFAEDIRPILGDTVRLEVSSEQGLYILGDAAQLHQVVTNLVRNAHDSMPRGGTISLRLETSSPAATAHFAGMGASDTYAHLQVVDNGSGIPPHVISHIFEPLFTTKERSGTGLGLPIAQRIVTAHGGQIRVESNPQSGTTFHVLLRKTSPAAFATGAALESSATWKGIRSVVLVEDEPSVAEGIMALLKVEGVSCEWFNVGRTAVERLRTFAPDLLILDVGLPDMSGIDVYREAVKTHLALPTIFSTGHGDHRMLGELTARAMVDFLTKPYDFETLSRKVDQLLSSRTISPDHKA